MPIGEFFKQVNIRTERVALGMISKKFVAWYASTYLLVNKYISGAEWVMLTAAIFALQIVQNRYNDASRNVYRKTNPVPVQGDTDEDA